MRLRVCTTLLTSRCLGTSRRMVARDEATPVDYPEYFRILCAQSCHEDDNSGTSSKRGASVRSA